MLLLLLSLAAVLRMCDTAFFRSMADCEVTDGWLNFGGSIPWSNHSCMYVRACYPVICNGIMKKTTADTAWKASVTGTPGIGKSYFLFYLLWRLLQKKKRVLLICHPETVYYDDKGGVFELSSFPNKTDHSFWSVDLWCLFDCKFKTIADLATIPMSRCRCVLSSSPRRAILNDFAKEPVPFEIFMPLWLETELALLAQKSYPNLGNSWRTRFSVLGGIPRHVLSVVKKKAETMVTEACATCSLDDCLKAIGSTISEKTPEVVHCLVHKDSVSPYTDYRMKFASDFVLDCLVRKHGNDAKHKMQGLLASCEDNPLIASFCGKIYEPYALGVLKEGGQFHCRELSSGRAAKPREVFMLHIPASEEIQPVAKLEENQLPHLLYVPINKNYTAFDAWKPGFGALQVTVGEKHDIRGKPQEELMKLGKEGNKLYWILPPTRFSSFTKKSPMEIMQYGVLVEYPSPRPSLQEEEPSAGEATNAKAQKVTKRKRSE